jgi:hypothetical protein
LDITWKSSSGIPVSSGRLTWRRKVAVRRQVFLGTPVFQVRAHYQVRPHYSSGREWRTGEPGILSIFCVSRNDRIYCPGLESDRTSEVSWGQFLESHAHRSQEPLTRTHSAIYVYAVVLKPRPTIASHPESTRKAAVSQCILSSRLPARSQRLISHTPQYSHLSPVQSARVGTCKPEPDP